MIRALIVYAVIVTVIEIAILAAHFTCLPDAENRFFMGRGTQGQCLYLDMESGEVWE